MLSECKHSHKHTHTLAGSFAPEIGHTYNLSPTHTDRQCTVSHDSSSHQYPETETQTNMQTYKHIDRPPQEDALFWWPITDCQHHTFQHVCVLVHTQTSISTCRTHACTHTCLPCLQCAHVILSVLIITIECTCDEKERKEKSCLEWA